jgi:hypothetical protein
MVHSPRARYRSRPARAVTLSRRASPALDPSVAPEGRARPGSARADSRAARRGRAVRAAASLGQVARPRGPLGRPARLERPAAPRAARVAAWPSTRCAIRSRRTAPPGCAATCPTRGLSRSRASSTRAGAGRKVRRARNPAKIAPRAPRAFSPSAGCDSRSDPRHASSSATRTPSARAATLASGSDSSTTEDRGSEPAFASSQPTPAIDARARRGGHPGPSASHDRQIVTAHRRLTERAAGRSPADSRGRTVCRRRAPSKGYA